MILAFDPVAQELLVDFETDDPVATLPMKDLAVKYYAPTAGTVVFTMDSTGLELSYYPLPGESSTLALVPTGKRTWRITFVAAEGPTKS